MIGPTVGASLFGRTRGVEIGDYRYGQEIFPIVLGNQEGENFSLNDINNIQIAQTRTNPVRIGDLVDSSIEWEPSVIQTRNGQLIARVFSELSPGFGYLDIVNNAAPILKNDPKLSSFNIELDGVAAKSDEANDSILKVIPLGMMLLLISLLVQFNSFRKVIVVSGSILPMMIGIVPGLIISGQYFGFLSLLGLLALIGIVVNNGILIVDQIDRYRDLGWSLEDSMIGAIKRRSKPIILTTLTTVFGLLPLVFTKATLWPPFAWTMIFGLLASMFLTPFFVPSLYAIFFGSRKGSEVRIKKYVMPSLLLPVFLMSSLVFADEKATSIHEIKNVHRKSSRVEISRSACGGKKD